MKTILVTGSQGYIGKHIVSALKEKKYKVIELDNFSNSRVPKNKKEQENLYDGSILDRKLLRSIFTKHQIGLVVHLASLISVEQSSKKPLDYFLINVSGTINLLQVMEEFNVSKLIFSSSAAVYGVGSGKALNEDSPTDPVNPYGDSKLAAEKIIINQGKTEKLNHVILRLFNIAGADNEKSLSYNPKRNPSHIIPIISDAIKEKKEFNIFGTNYDTEDGTCVRDYIHILDLVNVFLKSISYLENDSTSQIFNVGTGDGHSIKQLIDTAKDVLKVDISIKIGEKREGDPSHLVASISKISKELEFSPKYSLEEMITSEYKSIKN